MYGYKQAKKENGCIVKCNHQFFFLCPGLDSNQWPTA